MMHGLLWHAGLELLCPVGLWGCAALDTGTSAVKDFHHHGVHGGLGELAALLHEVVHHLLGSLSAYLSK